LIGCVVSKIVQENSEGLSVLRTGESRRPLYIAHSFLGYTPCVLKNEVVRDVPVVDDRLAEQNNRQDGAGSQQYLEPQCGMFAHT